MPYMHAIGKTATHIFIDEQGFTCVKYHNTIVLKFNEDRIILNSDGYKTVTTKNRINQASSVYELEFKLCQEKGEWKVYFKGYSFHFEDEMYLQRNGKKGKSVYEKEFFVVYKL